MVLVALGADKVLAKAVGLEPRVRRLNVIQNERQQERPLARRRAHEEERGADDVPRAEVEVIVDREGGPMDLMRRAVVEGAPVDHGGLRRGRLRPSAGGLRGPQRPAVQVEEQRP